MSRKFKEILLKIHKKSQNEQQQVLENFLEEWKSHEDKKGKTYEQVDDILVVGIEI